MNAFRAVQYSAQERCSKIREGVLESLRAAQYLQKNRTIPSEQKKYLEGLESSSVHTYRALQIEQRRCLGSLENCSVHTQRMMQGRRRRSVASLEGSSVLTKELCRGRAEKIS